MGGVCMSTVPLIKEDIDVQVSPLQQSVGQVQPVKLVLLGNQNAGKSTIFRQLQSKLEQESIMTLEQRRKFIPEIQQIVVRDMQKLIRLANEVSDLALHAKLKIADFKDFAEFDENIAHLICVLWLDPEIRKAIEKNRSRLSDSFQYFMGKAKIIGDPGYVPSFQDIIRCKQRLAGVQIFEFDLGNDRKGRIFDVGHQRCEVNQWRSILQGLDIILFVVSISEFDQYIPESNAQKTYLQDSLELFSAVNEDSGFLKDKPIILFLNKLDVFKERYSLEKFKASFPDYGSPDDAENAIQYIEDEFKKRANQKIFVYRVSAVDENCIVDLVQNVKESIRTIMK
jgi:GTPase SAR1 family protein